MPAATPVTIPVREPTVAEAGLVLLHIPPESDSPSVVVSPTHTEGVPVVGAGVGFTLTA